ncbi:MAG: hypothetical protein HY809_03585 [Nitrospirae bacterium]|nr:hypothetical protein [Nitrospirota bacterium]
MTLATVSAGALDNPEADINFQQTGGGGLTVDSATTTDGSIIISNVGASATQGIDAVFIEAGDDDGDAISTLSSPDVLNTVGGGDVTLLTHAGGMLIRDLDADDDILIIADFGDISIDLIGNGAAVVTNSDVTIRATNGYIDELVTLVPPAQTEDPYPPISGIDIFGDVVTLEAAVGIGKKYELEIDANTLIAETTSSAGDILINEPNDVKLENESTVDGNIIITAGGFIDVRNIEANGIGKDIILSSTGTGGTGDDIWLDNAYAFDDIFATAATGDIYVGTIGLASGLGLAPAEARSDDITLTATAGFITEHDGVPSGGAHDPVPVPQSSAGAGVDITGDVLTMTAGGNIGGTGEFDIETDVSTIIADSTVSGDIILTELDTNEDGVILSSIDTNNGDIILVTNGLSSESGNATVVRDVRSDTGIAADAGTNDVSIDAQSGDMEVDFIHSDDDIYLGATTAGGRIFEYNTTDLPLGDQDIDIEGELLMMEAGAGIGTDDFDRPENRFDTQVTDLAAVTQSGDINLENTGALNSAVTTTPFMFTGNAAYVGPVDGVRITGGNGLESADDNITVGASSPFTVVNGAPYIDIVGGDILLWADGTTAADIFTINDNITASGGNGNITLYSGSDILQDPTSFGGVTVSATGTGSISMYAGVDWNGGIPRAGYAGAGFADLIMDPTAVISSEDGNITMTATEEIEISVVNANSDADSVAGDVSISADDDTYLLADGVGAVEEVLASEASNVTADALTMSAATGIGDSGDIETNVTSVLATNSTSGEINIYEVGTDNDLIVLGATNLTTSAGSIDIQTNDGTLTVNGEVETEGTSSTITLRANDANTTNDEDLNINAAVTAVNGTVTLTSVTNDVNFAAAGDVTTTSGYVDVNAMGVAGAGKIYMADGALIDAGDDIITLDAQGDITIGGLKTNYNTAGNVAVYIETVAGAVIDGGDTHTDIDVDFGVNSEVVISAETGIGTDANGLETSIDEIAATTDSGDIHIINTGDLEIINSTGDGGAGAGEVRPVGVTIQDTAPDDSGNDNITITAASPLTVSADVLDSDGGDITLSAIGTATTDDLAINANVRSTYTVAPGDGGGNILLTAGDTVTISNSYTIEAQGSGSVTITADSDGDEDGAGGAVTMSNGSLVDAGSGRIFISADQDITLGRLLTSNATNSTGEGAVEITSTSAGIVDGGDSGTYDIDAPNGRLLTQTVTGVGRAGSATGGAADDAIETRVLGLEMENTVSGNIDILEANDVNIYRIVQMSPEQTDNNGFIRVVTTNGSINVIDNSDDTEPVIIAVDGTGNGGADGGSVRLTAGGLDSDVNINDGITTEEGYVTIRAADSVTFGRDGVAAGRYGYISAPGPRSVTITANTDALAGNTGDVITMADGAVIDAGSGTIEMKTTGGGFGGNITLGGIITTNTSTTAVTIATDAGVIDGGDTDIDIVANSGRVVIDAVKGVGSANAIETSAGSLDVDNVGAGVAGMINIAETDAVTVIELDNDGLKTLPADIDGDITLTAGGTITVADETSLGAGVIALDGDILLDANGANSSILSYAVIQTASDESITITADDDVKFMDATANVTATGTGNVIVRADAEGTADWDDGALFMANGSLIDAGSGTITLSADEDITLGGLVTTNATADAVSITSTSGAVLDGGDLNTDIIANTGGAVTTITAFMGIGSNGVTDNALETQVVQVELVNTIVGDIRINEVAAGGNLIVDHAIMLDALGTYDGDININTADGDLILEANDEDGYSGVRTNMDGTITLTAGGGIGDTLYVNSVVESVNGDIDMNGADSVIFTAPGDVTSITGDVTVDANTSGLGAGGSDGYVITMVDGTVIDAGSGTISLNNVHANDNSGDITVGRLLTTNATNTAVTINTDGGVVDTADSDGVDIDAANGRLVIDAQDGVGSTGAIETTVDSIDVDNTITGNIQIFESNSIDVIQLDNDMPDDSNGATGIISLTTTDGSIIVVEDDNTGAPEGVHAIDGNILLLAQDADLLDETLSSITVNAAVETTDTPAPVSPATITIRADNDVIFGVEGDVTAQGSGSVTVIADDDAEDNGIGGAIFMADNTVDAARIDAGSGLIIMSADENITLGGLTTTNATATAVTIDSTSGAILDGGDVYVNIDANSDDEDSGADLTAVTGIGTDANAIETTLEQLQADTVSGDIHVRNTAGDDVDLSGDLNITGTGVGITDGAFGDNITIETASPLNVNAAVTNTGGNNNNGVGSITLAAEGSAASDDLTIDAAISTVCTNAANCALYGYGDISLYAGDDVVHDSGAAGSGDITAAGSGDIDVHAGVNYNNGTPTTGNADSDITMADGRIITSGSGNITITATDNAAVSIVSTTGDVSISADDSTYQAASGDGAITDVLSGEASNVIADDLTMSAATGIGSGIAGDVNDIDTTVATVIADNSTSGTINIDETNALTVLGAYQANDDSITIIAGTTLTVGESGTGVIIDNIAGGADSDIFLRAEDGNLDVDQVVRNDSNVATSDIDIDAIDGAAAASANIDITAAVTAEEGNIRIVADDDIDFGIGGDVTTNTTVNTVYVRVTADDDGDSNGGIFMDDNDDLLNGDSAVIDSNTGFIQMTAAEDIMLGSLTSTGDTASFVEIYVSSSSGSIIDGGDSAVDIDANTGDNSTAVLIAAGEAYSGSGTGEGIGEDSNGLETTIRNIAATTLSGDININNTGPLDIENSSSPLYGGAGSGRPNGVTITAGGGDADDNITVTASSPLTVNAVVTNNVGGDILLAAEGTTAGAGLAGDNLMINANVSALGGNGNISLYAGHYIDLATTVTVHADGSGDILASAGENYAIATGHRHNGSGANTADVNMQSGSIIETQDGDITLRASGDVLLSRVNADADNDAVAGNPAVDDANIGDVTITADYDGVNGGLSDNTGYISEVLSGGSGDGETINIIAELATLRAATGIGAVAADGDIETSIERLDAINNVTTSLRTADVSSDIVIFEDATGVDAVDVDLWIDRAWQMDSSPHGVENDGDINIQTENGNLTVYAGKFGVAAYDDGTVTLTAGNNDVTYTEDLVIDDAIDTERGKVTLTSEDDDVRFGVEGDVTTTSGEIEVNATSENDAPGGDDAGAVIFMADNGLSGEAADTAILNAGDDIIDLNADERITLGGLITTSTSSVLGSEAVNINSDDADVVDGGDTAIDIVANSGRVVIDAVTGVGETLFAPAADAAIETSAGSLDVDNIDGDSPAISADGAIAIDETDDVTVIELDNNALKTSDTDGDITLTAGGTITVADNSDGGVGVIAVDGDILLDANGVASSIKVYDEVTTAGNESIQILADDDVIFSVEGDVTATGTGDITIKGDAEGTADGDEGAVTMSDIVQGGGPDTTLINADSGTITVTADEDITIGRLYTTNATANAVRITSTSGAVIDAGDSPDLNVGGSTADISANSTGAITTISAVQGIGSRLLPDHDSTATVNPADSAIETEVYEIALDNASTGDIRIVEIDFNTVAEAIDNLIVDHAVMADPFASLDGDISIQTTNGDLIIEVPDAGETLGNGTNGVSTRMDGTITLIAGGRLANNDSDLMINAGIDSIDGDITLTADDDVFFNSSTATDGDTDGDVTTITGDVRVTADADNDNTAAATGGEIFMADDDTDEIGGGAGLSLAEIDAGTGTITMRADGDVTLGQLRTTNDTNSAVVIQSKNAGIIDGGDGTGGTGRTEDIIAPYGRIVMDAVTGIGSTLLNPPAGSPGPDDAAIEIDGDSVDAENLDTEPENNATAAGNIDLLESDDIDVVQLVNRVANDENAATGTITLRTIDGTITLIEDNDTGDAEGVRAIDGNIVLDANDTNSGDDPERQSKLIINAPITNTDRGNITLLADDNVEFGLEGDVTITDTGVTTAQTNAGDVIVEADDDAVADAGVGGAIIMSDNNETDYPARADATVIDTFAGLIRMSADEDIIVGQLTTGHNAAGEIEVVLESMNGSILDAGDSANGATGVSDIVVDKQYGSVALIAEHGIGTDANSIETTLREVAATTEDGDIHIRDVDVSVIDGLYVVDMSGYISAIDPLKGSGQPDGVTIEDGMVDDNITIIAASPLTIDAPVTNTGGSSGEPYTATATSLSMPVMTSTRMQE